MIIKRFKINNLRNISAAEIEPDPVLNVFVGNNGAGKTSVLEALVVVAKGRSFRAGHVSSLIGPQGASFVVMAETENAAGQRNRLGIERWANCWHARKNGRDCRQLGELAGALPLVLMEPNSHLLVSGAPEGRRRYLDWTVFHVEHTYLATWRRYNRALKQRNAALRSRDVRLAASLEPVLAHLGAQIDELRSAQAEQISRALPDCLEALGATVPAVTVGYHRGWSGNSVREALDGARDRDLDRGSTASGPHRADLRLQVGGSPARECLSRGEQKLFAAGLLLVQAEAIAATGMRPVFLLDDLASEFDERHKNAVLNACLETGAQVWVTGTSLRALLRGNRSRGAVFHVEHGLLRPSHRP